MGKKEEKTEASFWCPPVGNYDGCREITPFQALGASHSHLSGTVGPLVLFIPIFVLQVLLEFF